MKISVLFNPLLLIEGKNEAERMQLSTKTPSIFQTKLTHFVIITLESLYPEKKILKNTFIFPSINPLEYL